MHVVILTRGIKHAVDRWINELSTKFLPFKWQSPTDKEPQDYALQLRVSPIQLYDISFPEPMKDLVLASVLGDSRGEPINKGIKKYVAVLRKMMGLKKIPDFETKDKMPCTPERQHIEIVGIGVKDDVFKPTADPNVKNEGI